MALCACPQLARETTCVQRAFALPDGRSICAGAERFAAPEALFRPLLLGCESPGLAELVFACVQVHVPLLMGALPASCCVLHGPRMPANDQGDPAL